MDLSDFRIGSEFTCSGRRYRCTDIGIRTVLAIQVDEATIASKEPGEPVTTRLVSGHEAEAIGWFTGPPYSVIEHVFDEEDQDLCEPV
ncbi:hypothetical protein FV232_25250 [Methylobacterium sp. WL30]|uniref:hypothetical protein n=1 Tax=unclassified Methylobacterium TaxID=2615210 RepID=UPI0011C9FF24|nr:MULTISPECIES: hypothetical protein [unclassified Methylobacterium]TXN39938.1 hypothetical protein FV225_07970 [Methylobacterium sp. WL93]TXN46803.1 hypothetical protein FV227_22855 [Methylobacterium sp. WL119]TXN62560.1 hypothetical protein FV232_25250 [Methylobacterium sp. WL30]